MRRYFCLTLMFLLLVVPVPAREAAMGDAPESELHAEFLNPTTRPDIFTYLAENYMFDSSGISGIYRISHAGNPSSDTSYEGKVAVAQFGNVYRLGWKFPTASGHEGVGLMVDRFLCAAWTEGGAYGVVVYRVNGGRLEGQWVTSHTDGRIGTEELEGPSGVNGVYQIVNAYEPYNGGSYRGTVTIKKFGETYEVTWRLSNESYTGVGILENDLLIVGWGPQPNVGVVYYEVDGDELRGRWAFPGSGSVGTENLARQQE